MVKNIIISGLMTWAVKDVWVDKQVWASVGMFFVTLIILCSIDEGISYLWNKHLKNERRKSK